MIIENNLESIKNQSQKIVKDRTITVGAKALFFYILNAENTQTPCTLGKYLNELIKSGYITCFQGKENGRFSTNHYTLNIKE